MKGSKTIVLMIVMLTAALVFAGCSGGGGGSSSGSGGVVQSLKVGERVSVVDAQGSQSSNQINALTIAGAVADLPAGSPYNTDETHTYVEERSSESFDIINEILCMMAQTGYDEMLNQGDYKAMINMTQCEGSKDNAESAGQASQNQSSGANADEYEYWTVNSSREDNDSPQIVKVWVHEKEEDYGGGDVEPAKTIHVKTVITESKNATNPYGIFTLNFSGVSDDTGQEFFSGYLKTERNNSGEVLLKFYESGQHGQGSGTQQVTLNRAADGSSGSGSVAMTHSWQDQGQTRTESRAFNIAYNDNYFLRNDGTNDVCLNRTNTESSVWRYGVYYDENHATPGARVDINSGFPIKYTDISGNNYQGWAGYHGLWIPEDAPISDGDTVYKQDYSGNGTTETEYTMFMAGGKLRRHTKMTVTLGDINGVPISWNECSDQGGGNWVCIDSRVKWNGTQFVKDAVRSEQTNWVWDVLDSPVVVTPDPNAWDFHFWSESLGGNGRINLMNNQGQQIILSDATPVIFHVEDTVYPGDTVPSTLACFENCPDPLLVNSQSEPFFAKSTWQDPNNFDSVNQSTAPANLVADTNYIEYTFDSTMELKHNGTPVVMTTAPQGVEYGTWSGTMFAATPENFALLACDWDANSTCAWKAWDMLNVFYTWETGVDNWNRLSALKDANNSIVSFDPPLNVEYTHSSGAKYYLEYNGFGDLHGIPGKCVDEDTGQDTDCYNPNGDKFIRWVPDFSLPDGSTVKDAVATPDTFYYVKGLEKEERMIAEDNAATCTSAGLEVSDYPLPGETLYVAPDIGTEPTVDGAPAVIAGEVQE